MRLNLHHPVATLLRRLVPGGLVLMLLALAAGLGVPGSARAAESVHVIKLHQAWIAPADSPAFPPMSASSPQQELPDIWADRHPGHAGTVWYRVMFDAPRGTNPHELLGVFIPRVCTNFETFLNGHLVHSGGRMTAPVTRQCYRSQLVTLPPAMVKPTGNWLDIKVVGEALESVSSRQRAGYLSELYVGPRTALVERQEDQIFWSITVAQVLAGTLAALGLFSVLLAWVRQIPFALHFGLMCLVWSALGARLWIRDVPWSSTVAERLTVGAFVPVVSFAILFLIRYRSIRAPRIEAVLWAQCLIIPGLLAIIPDNAVFRASQVVYALLTVQLAAMFVTYLVHSWRRGRSTFSLMAVVLALTIVLFGIELGVQFGGLQLPSLSMTNVTLPLLFGAVGLRLLQFFVQTLQAAEDAKAELEIRVQEATDQIERNFSQMADLRAEQVAEQERKRIAGDLHDDLGAKLLTIVHMSDNERISTLAREALEEMRLSVRGLTGKPVRVADAVGDWRAETVMRLSQAGIEVEWNGEADQLDKTLNARAYVQVTRIIREATNNIIKHSGASRCDVTAEVDPEDFRLVIRDNGRGIPIESEAQLDRGHGMTSMKRRAKQIQGQCLVESGPGYGTVIRLTLPL